LVRLLLPSALLAGLLFVTAPAKANPGNSPAFEELDGTWVYTLTLIEFDKAGDFPIAEYIDGRSFVIDARPDGTGSLLFFSEPRDLTHNSTQKTAEGRWDLIREDVMSDGSLSIYEFLETITYERGFIEIKEAYSFYNELTLGLIPGIPADQQNMQRLPRQWVNTITHTYHGTVSLENGNYIIKGEHRMEASSNPDDPNYFISLEQTNYIRSTWEAIKIDAGTTPPPPGEPPGDYPGAPFYILPGLGGLGSIPGPDGYVQAVAGILLPGLLSILLGALGSAGGAPLAPTPPLSPSGGGPYLFDDGREYYEGRNYTIQVGDSCTEYRVVDGDLVPVRELRSGEAYIDVDGNPKIWIGGQSWHEEDWRRQAATNREYEKAHRESVEKEHARRQQEAKAEEAARQKREEERLAEQMRQEHIQRLHKKYGTSTKEGLIKVLDRNMRWNYEDEKRHLDYSNSRALRWGETTAKAIKWAADTAIDVGAIAVPGGKYVKAGYKVITGSIEQGYKGGTEVDVYKGLRGAVGGAIEAGKDFVPKTWSRAGQYGMKFLLNVGSETVKSGLSMEGAVKGLIKGGVELVTQGTMEYFGFKPPGYKEGVGYFAPPKDDKTLIQTMADHFKLLDIRMGYTFGTEKLKEEAVFNYVILDILDTTQLADYFFPTERNALTCRGTENLIKTLGNYIFQPK